MSFVHFELIFMGLGKGLTLFFLHVDIMFYLHCLLEELSFSPTEWSWLPCQNHLTICVFISGLLIRFYWCIYLSYANSHCFCYCSFVILIDLKSGSEETPVLFIFRIVSAVHGPLRFHMNFKMGFSVSTKKVFGILKEIILHWVILTF